VSDPLLKTFSSSLKYTSTDGYRMEFTAKGGKGTTHAKTGEEVPSQVSLIATLKEAYRWALLYGFDADADAALADAKKAILEWHESRKESNHE
jgi:hypothetical protein